MPSCVSSQPMSVLAIFSMGLISGAAGGLLLGRTAVVLLQSLELLSENKQLMHQLESYIVNTDLLSRDAKAHGLSQRTPNDHVFNSFISMLTWMFGVCSMTFALPMGVLWGVSVYELIIRKYGDPATGKALALAGPVCLMGITATSYVLGFAFEAFIYFTSSVSVWLWYFISLLLIVVTSPIFVSIGFSLNIFWSTVCIFTPLNSPAVVLVIYLMNLFLKSKLTLIPAVLPTVLLGFVFQSHYNIYLCTAPVPIMLIITDVFNIAQQPIVSPQLATETSSAVVEGLFVGALSSQMLMAAIGMSLFVTWQRSKIGNICAGAAALGATLVAVIESALGVMGPGPTIGAVMGVAWAAGVSLTAAGEVAYYYGEVVGRCGWVGRLGVTVGAGVGAFLSSCTHRGLSGVFMGLCAASVHAGLFCDLFYSFFRRSNKRLFSDLLLTIILALWLYFTCTVVGTLIVLVLVAAFLLSNLLHLCLSWASQ